MPEPGAVLAGLTRSFSNRPDVALSGPGESRLTRECVGLPLEAIGMNTGLGLLAFGHPFTTSETRSFSGPVANDRLIKW